MIGCWGYNAYGQAEAPPGVYQAMSAGALHNCVLKADGTVGCWGDNRAGQAEEPPGVYQAVSAGTLHNCALAADGTILCWGDDRFGQVNAPDGAYKSVVAGGLHSCAIAADDTVVCWGHNEFGQSDAPAGAFKAVALGAAHSCAVASDDTVACWGANDLGQADARDGTYRAVIAGNDHSCALATDGTIICWGPVPPPKGVSWVSADSPDPQREQPEPEPEPVPVLEPEPSESAVGSGGGPVRPGEGVFVLAGRADWYVGYFQAELYRLLLEELGYTVSDPAELERGPSSAYTAMALGDMDYWPNSWYPAHYQWHDVELPDGSRVGDHLSVVGEELIAGGLQGFLVTKSFADAYGVYTMDELNRNAEALAAFDATDPVPGNGRADIFGCPELWTCDDIIENMIAFSGWNNIAQTRDGYEAMLAQAVRRVDRGVPMVIYTWTPSDHIVQLPPGDGVYWMGVERILDGSNPANQQSGEQHSQRGPDGTGGFATIGPDQCPSAAARPDGRCPIGWLVADVLVTASTAFLETNPAAKALFEAVKLRLVEVSQANMAVRNAGFNASEVAAQWIADNRDRVDQWLAAARAAAGAAAG